MRYVRALTNEQRAFLSTSMKEDASFRARTRAHSLLLSAQGVAIQDIAQTYQVDRATVSAWIKKWATMGQRVCMINRAVAGRANSPLTNRSSPNSI